MMVAAVFLIGSVFYTIFSFVVGPVVDKVVSTFDQLDACIMNLLFGIQGHNRYFTLFGLFVGGLATTAMGILYTLGIMLVMLQLLMLN